MFLYEDHKEVKSFSYAKIKYILVLADVSIFDNNQLQQLELRTIKKDVGEEKNSFWVLRYHIWNKSIIIWYFGEFWIMELHWHKICLGSFITDRVFTAWKSMELLKWITGLQTEYGMYQGQKKNKSWTGANPSAGNYTTKNLKQKNSYAGSGFTKISDIKRSRQRCF